MASNLLTCRVPSSETCEIIAGERVAAEFEDMLSDESKLRARSAASLALPRTTDQLSSVLARHHRDGHRVVISGARTGLTGGAVPTGGEHLVSVSRLGGISGPFDVGGEKRIRLGAGVTLDELEAHLINAAPEWFYPVDPTESSASIGGTVATDAAGGRSLRYGRTRDWVRGLTVVLVDGRILELGRGVALADSEGFVLTGAGQTAFVPAPTLRKPACKRALGPDSGPGMDAVDLFVGAEGTLGAVAQVELALARRPEHRLVYLQFFAREEVGFAFADWARALRGDAADTLAVEWLDRRALSLAAESGAAPRLGALVQGDGGGSPGIDAAVFCEIAASDDDALEALLERIMQQVERVGADPEQSGVGLDSGSLAEIRAFRHAVPERINALIARRRATIPGLTKVATDMAVPDGRMRDIYARYREVFSGLGLDFAAFGHLGDNHLHVNVLPESEAQVVAARDGYRALAAEVVAMGGAVSAEHGFGRIKREFLALQFGPSELEVLGRIKGAFDPQGRLNPGVLVDPVPAPGAV